jgi:transposase
LRSRIRPEAEADGQAAEVVPDCKKRTLQAIIRGRVAPEVVIHSDGWRGYNGLVDVGHAKHFQLQTLFL